MCTKKKAIPNKMWKIAGEPIRWFMDRGVAEPRARELAFGAMFAYYSDAGEHTTSSMEKGTKVSASP